jgi:nitric-oxide synthase
MNIRLERMIALVLAHPADEDEHSAGELIDAAQEFFDQLTAEQPGAASATERLAQALQEIAESGSYWHTPGELSWGAKVAWRNTPRCLGKFYWKALTVRDMRHLATADDVFAALVEHLRAAHNDGRVKLLMTVFAPRRPGAAGIRIWNKQLVCYAGHRQADGTVVGDPDNADFTDAVRRLGWTGGTGGRFDVLPLVIQMSGEPPRIYELPPDAAAEVPISHPDFDWFAELGLRWHAFPSVSDQRLEIGGVSYPAAPFSAWYTAAEVGARNLSDANRYDMLPAIGEAMGLDTANDRSLWRDRAMLELVTAVLHSFDHAGVSVIDHHFAARQFMKHEAREQAAGRITPAHWELIVSPLAGSADAVWQRRYEPLVLRPNFFAQPAPWEQGAVTHATHRASVAPHPSDTRSTCHGHHGCQPCDPLAPAAGRAGAGR